MNLLADKTQLAALLSIAPKIAEAMMADGTMPTVEVGGQKRVRLADVQTYIAALPVATP